MSRDVVDMTPLSVLLAEDNVVNQRVAAALLATIGHRVTVCNNGREAVQAVESGHFDVILMDIQMPVLDGLAATAEIRALPDRAKAAIPILAISANVREDDVARYREGGIDHVLSKPLRPDSLKAMLARILGDAPAPPTAAPPALPPEDLMDGTQVAALREALPPEKLSELYGLAKESLLTGADLLRDGWQKGDPGEIKTAAHRVAGVARNFGCLALGKCAARIEEAAKAGGTGQDQRAAFEALLTASLTALPTDR
ncbi:MAG TPA: response regulator [Magnetospirillaceae bacterium]|nr:response regulator [Magnetospirillaceae bacterium]